MNEHIDPIARLDADKLLLENALTGAQHQHARLALKAAQGDAQAVAALAEVEQEIAGHERDLSRVAAARKAALQMAADDSAAARAQALAQAKVDAILGAKARVKAAEKAQKALGSLESALSEFTAAGAASKAALLDAARHAGQFEPAVAVAGFASGSTAGIEQALHEMLQRLAALGSPLSRSIVFSSLSCTHGTPSQVASDEVDRLHRAIDPWVPLQIDAAPVAPAVEVSMRSMPLIKVVDGTSRVVGLEGSQHV